MELLITQHNNGEIAWNADELTAQIKAFVGEYANIAYTEETVKDAKKDRAEVRKKIDEIEKRRKEIKKAYMDGYNKFEAQVKEAMTPLVELEQNIKVQVDEVETVRKAKRMQEIKAEFAEIDFPFPIPLEAIYRPQWENASTTIKSIRTEMCERAASMKGCLEVLERLPNAFEAVEIYKETLDMNRAIAESDRIADLQRKKEELEKERKALEAETAKQKVAEIPAKKVVEAAFVVRCTIPQLKALKAFLNENGIEYEG